ncbi:protein kinase domain containing protein [Stylonychia lemnae]|uniref:Protein kinase domain containing protein n=1 Tax=Stylonychia lemnae TaxID=5949 RepID=A0A077ZT50_STYLE|nr:protein kinase domain containing protein [Stylonychia lemnae]|eukprot:CDW73062.1 protein kinase domain containing protein [Stylonychia lemnae]
MAIITENASFKTRRSGFNLQIQYDIGDVIGQSSEISETRLCQKKQGQKETRILKIIKRQPAMDLKRLNKILSDILNQSHPGLLKTEDIFYDDTNLYIVQQQAVQGDLFKVLEAKPTFIEADVVEILHQLLGILSYKHDSNVAIKNMKPSNILFHTGMKEGEKIHISLADVGLADINRSGDPYFTDYKQHMSPELVYGQLDQLGCKTDIWSLGTILYFMITLRTVNIYNGLNKESQNLFKAVDENFGFEEHNWNNISDELKDLIKSCLRVQADQRPSAQDLLKNPIFTQKNVAKEGLLNQGENADLLKDIHEELTKYKNANQLKQIVLRFVSQQDTQYSNEDKTRELFSILEAENKGFIRKRNLVDMLSSQYGVVAATKIVDAVDGDKDGKISYDEFRAAMDKDGKLSNQELMDGLILGSEIFTRYKNEFQAMASEVLQKFDDNKDGELDKKEFRNYIMDHFQAKTK